MDCILKAENESGILGELQDDSDSVQDLSHCPEDMTVIYTDIGWWQGATSCRPYWDNLSHIPTGHISPEDICKRDNDSLSIWICSKLAHPPQKIHRCFVYTYLYQIGSVGGGEQGLGLWSKRCGCYWPQELSWMPGSLGWQGDHVRKASPLLRPFLRDIPCGAWQTQH